MTCSVTIAPIISIKRVVDLSVGIVFSLFGHICIRSVALLVGLCGRIWADPHRASQCGANIDREWRGRGMNIQDWLKCGTMLWNSTTAIAKCLRLWNSNRIKGPSLRAELHSHQWWWEKRVDEKSNLIVQQSSFAEQPLPQTENGEYLVLYCLLY